MTNQKKSLAAQWPWLCGLLGILFSFSAEATDPLYQNDAYLTYTIPPQILPTIDATSFVNNNTFIVDFTSPTLSVETLETWNTLNYTNIGLLEANAPLATNGVFLTLAPGCGFLFDLQTTNVIPRKWAANFYNEGEVRINSAVDNPNAPFLATAGKFTVLATNIINSGIVEAGQNSLIQFSGKNVDLGHCDLVVEGTVQNSDLGTAGFTFLDEAAGFNPALTWHPEVDLTPTSAAGSEPIFFPPSSYTVDTQALGRMRPLTNSIAYFQQPFPVPAANNVIVRAIFIQDSSPAGVSYDTYFGDTSLGSGAAHVVWHAPAYIDPVSGLVVTNYLVLSDLYISATNNPPLGGLLTGTPFTIVTTNTPNAPSILAGFNSPGFQGFPGGFVFLPPNNEPVTNNGYAFVSLQFTPTTTATNSSSSNVTNYLATMSGRIQISADNNLDLTAANISNPLSSGLNYLSLRAPTQFNGSEGARIFSPYSDINIGVTNGNLTVTNLLEPGVPNWSGSLQAWTSDWLYTDAGTGVQWDFRVLLINSSLNPITPAQVQDLAFHATNNLVISDVFNVLRKVSIDAQNLTLTVDGPNSLAPDGELNMQAIPLSGQYTFVWSNAFPNLHNLTNNGSVRVPNVNPVNLGSSTSPYGTIINNGFFSAYGLNISVNDFENGGAFSNGALGSFILKSRTTTLTNGLLYAGGDVSISTGTMLASNVVLRANRSLTIVATNQLTDTGATNGSSWFVGSASTGTGFNVPLLPNNSTNRDLLGTTITAFAPFSKNVVNTWPGVDYGATVTGYSNNLALGRLIVDSLGITNNTFFTFKGATVSNALYVDYLELRDIATNRDGNGNFGALHISTNIVIYYAQAVMNGASIAEKMNHKNGDRLRWVPAYAGQFSSTNLVFGGTTNTVNTALAQASDIDSDGDGIPNNVDPVPFFLSSQVSLTVTSTNVPPLSMALTWNTISYATNNVIFTTNLVTWQTLTQFVSGVPYPSGPAPVTIYDPVGGPTRYYQVYVTPWLTWPY